HERNTMRLIGIKINARDIAPAIGESTNASFMTLKEEMRAIIKAGGRPGLTREYQVGVLIRLRLGRFDVMRGGLDIAGSRHQGSFAAVAIKQEIGLGILNGNRPLRDHYLDQFRR